MKIICLVENTSSSEEYKAVHGLSFYIETESHKVLFDVGPDDTFIENAKRKGIVLSLVDTLVISHGHNDHGGALSKFFEINKIAKAYIKEEAFIKHYSKMDVGEKYIGLDLEMDRERFVYTPDYLKIDDELEIFSGVKGDKFYSRMNDALLMEEDEAIVHDNFNHEQYLIVSENDKTVLMTGCSHKGIVNIVDKFDELTSNRPLKAVIGGFHLFNPRKKVYETKERILDIANWITNREETYYTCHCTGEAAYRIMNVYSGGKIKYIASGDELKI